MAQDEHSDLARVGSVHRGRIPGSADGWSDEATWEQFAEALRSGPG
jgi:hypothetical protein